MKTYPVVDRHEIGSPAQSASTWLVNSCLLEEMLSGEEEFPQNVIEKVEVPRNYRNTLQNAAQWVVPGLSRYCER